MVRLRILAFALTWSHVGAAAWSDWSDWSSINCGNTTIRVDTMKSRSRTCNANGAAVDVGAAGEDGLSAEVESSSTEADTGTTLCVDESGNATISETRQEILPEDRCDDSNVVLIGVLCCIVASVVVLSIAASMVFKNFYEKQKDKSRRLRVLEDQAEQTQQNATGGEAQKHRPAWFQHHFSTLRQLVVEMKHEKQNIASVPTENEKPRRQRPRPSDERERPPAKAKPANNDRQEDRRHAGKPVSRRRSEISSETVPESSATLDLWGDKKKVKFDWLSPPVDPAVSGPHSPSKRDPRNSIIRMENEANSSRHGSPKHRLEQRPRNRVHESHGVRQKRDGEDVGCSQSPRQKRRDPDHDAKVYQSQSPRRPQSPRHRDDPRPQSPRHRDDPRSHSPRQKRRLPLTPSGVDRHCKKAVRDTPFGFYKD